MKEFYVRCLRLMLLQKGGIVISLPSELSADLLHIEDFSDGVSPKIKVYKIWFDELVGLAMFYQKAEVVDALKRWGELLEIRRFNGDKECRFTFYGEGVSCYKLAGAGTKDKQVVLCGERGTCKLIKTAKELKEIAFRDKWYEERRTKASLGFDVS